MSLKEIYIKKVIQAMKEKFGYKNILAVPKVTKVTLNMGTGRLKQEAKLVDEAENILTLITGQKAVKTKAKKAISAFKIRQGMDIGLKVTLRGEKMYSFIDRLINFSLPRARDFQGLNEKSIDKCGNLTIGIKEHIIFPEISQENIFHIFGFEVVITTTSKTKEEGLELFKLLGFPIKK